MLKVSLAVFSGRPDPSWTLSDREEVELLDRIAADPSIVVPVTESTLDPLTGYAGFLVVVIDDPNPFKNQVYNRLGLPKYFRIGGKRSPGMSGRTVVAQYRG